MVDGAWCKATLGTKFDGQGFHPVLQHAAAAFILSLDLSELAVQETTILS